MTATTSHALIDANVARSATDPARHPTSEACFAVATVMADRSCATNVGMTDALFEEWRRHANPIMTRWLAGMEQRRRVLHRPDKRVSDFRQAIDSVEDAGSRSALLKDAHLSDAAIYYGWVVISQDDNQARHLQRLSDRYEQAGKIRWVNPVSRRGEWEEWLKGGCVDSSTFTCESYELPGR